MLIDPETAVLSARESGEFYGDVETLRSDHAIEQTPAALELHDITFAISLTIQRCKG